MASICVCSKDVRLPVQLQRAMATEAEATREARAKVRLIPNTMLLSSQFLELIIDVLDLIT